MGGPSIRNSRQDLFGGVEFSKRDLTVPFLDFTVILPTLQLEKRTGTSIWAVPIFSGHLIHGWHSERNIYLSDLKRDEQFPAGADGGWIRIVCL